MKREAAPLLIIVLCLFAMLRVAFYSAVFPFFNNVDEEAHLDAVVKYSEGHFSTQPEKLSARSVEFIALHSSPEFFFKPGDFPGGRFPAALHKEPDNEK